MGQKIESQTYGAEARRRRIEKNKNNLASKINKRKNPHKETREKKKKTSKMRGINTEAGYR